MNDIYWHDKRSIPSKQLTTPPPTQPRRTYENTIRTKQYQQTDMRMNSQSITNRNITSPYFQYPNVSNRTNNSNGNFPYTSSLYGVYQQSPPPPPMMTSPLPLHPNQHRHMNLRNQNQQSQQQRQISRSVDENYYTTKYQEINLRNDKIYYDDDDDDDDNEEVTSEVFNYTFDDTGVSLKKIFFVEYTYQYNLICHVSLFISYPFS